MTNFVYTVIPASEYKDKHEVGNRTIFHFNPVEEGDIITCIECSVNTEDANEEQIKNDLNTFINQSNIKKNNRKILNVISKINEYDKSSQVNGVTINGMYTWFDKATRVGLRNSTNVLKKLGNETTSLWVNNKEITIKCDQLTDMLDKLEIYALNCFDITSKHKRNVYQLSTIEEIENYDYTSGYPEKLTFTYE